MCIILQSKVMLWLLQLIIQAFTCLLFWRSQLYVPYITELRAHHWFPWLRSTSSSPSPSSLGLLSFSWISISPSARKFLFEKPVAKFSCSGLNVWIKTKKIGVNNQLWYFNSSWSSINCTFIDWNHWWLYDFPVKYFLTRHRSTLRRQRVMGMKKGRTLFLAFLFPITPNAPLGRGCEGRVGTCQEYFFVFFL